MNGYRRYMLRNVAGKKYHYTAHALVCELFHGPKPSRLYQVAHHDGNKLNNHYSNLRWATAKENNADKTRHGTQQRGEKNYNAKLTDEIVRAIRAEHTGRYGNLKHLSRKFGIPYQYVWDICHYRCWKHVKGEAA